MRLPLLLSFLAGLLLPAQAAERYDNARFGYSVTIPDGFGRPREADNGDGVTVRSVQGNATLLIYGFGFSGGAFAEQAGTGLRDDADGGWALSLRKVGASAASWSGTRDGRILYVRAIALCDEAVGTFRLEYDANAKARFDGIVTSLVKSFRAGPCS